MQKGGDLAQVYRRLVKAVKKVKQQVKFAHSKRYGYLTFCPTNLGTTLRASVHLKIPKLSANKTMMAEALAKHKLQSRGTYGYNTESVGGVYDISNKRRLGLSEIEAVTEMADGVKAIIAMEKELEEKESNTNVGMKCIDTIDGMYSILEKSDSKSLLKKYLTPDKFKKLRSLKTKLGGTLAHCINSGVEHLESSNGIYACDPEGYETFKDILDPIIKEYHKFENSDIKHPDPDFGNLANLPFGDVDPDGRYVVSTRVRVGRSVDGIPFPPTINKAQRAEVERKIMKAFDVLQNDKEYEGTYYQLPKLTPQEADQLRMDHFLFSETDDIARSAGIYRDWSDSRGIYCSNDKKFLVWVNEEDHYRLISMQKGGDLAKVYRRLVKAIKTVEQQVTFAHSKRFGYLTFCPTNLGTTLRASVHVKIPRLSANKKMMEEICAEYKLQPRGIHGEHTESVGGVYDISNKRRLGLSEIDAVTEMADGVKAIIAKEKELEKIWEYQGSIEDMYTVLVNSNSKSLLKKYLTREVFDSLKDKKTSLGGTLAHCINSGIVHLESSNGIYACDPEGYETFKDILYPIIKEYHKFENSDIKHPDPDFGNLANLPFGDVDPDGRYVVSTRVRVGRSADGIPFAPSISETQRAEVENKIMKAFEVLQNEKEYQGTYYQLPKLTPEEADQLRTDHFLFSETDDIARSAGIYRNWSDNRGIYCSNDKKFLVWVNEEDHYRLISMQKGGDLAKVYRRLVKAIKTVEQQVTFAHSKRFGYLTFCPTNLGTTLRASVHVKIPRLSANKKMMEEICAEYKLQPRGIHGEHTESVGGVYDISNKRRLGLSEIDAVTEMADGVKAIIAKEKELVIVTLMFPVEIKIILLYQGSIEDMYTVLVNSNSKSLLKKYLTRDVFDSLKDKKTNLGGTLAHCINSGIVHLESSNGIYACDPEGYETFKGILDPIIKEYHKFENSDIKHPDPNFGNLANLPFGDVDPDGRYVVSTRVRVGRSADGIPFAPSISETQRAEVENKIMKAFEVLQNTNEYQGTYYQLPKLTPQEADQLRNDHFLFSETDDIARSAGIYRNWSDNRGIYCSNDKKFLVWVNEEDHYRLISMQKGGDLAKVYRRLVKAIKIVEQQVTFAHSKRFGYLTFCPTNLGTTLRASVHVKIPRLSANKKMMQEVCAEHKLQPRGIHGEHTESVGGVYDISNKRRLGLTEIDAVTEMAEGVKAIIAKEKELEKIWEYQGSIEDMYTVLTESNSKSLLKKYLTREVFESLKDKKTSLGGTLAHCINSGVVHLESSNGIYACDPEGYETFKDILDPIIKEYHKFENSDIKHPDPNFGNLANLPFGDVDPDGRYVVSTRVRVGRSADGIPFAPSISETQRAEVENKIMKAFESLQSDSEYEGTYYQLPNLTSQEADQLRMDHFLFSETDDIARSAGIYRNWSNNRGIYCSNDKKFLVWVNEEDHYRLISMQKGGDLAQVYRRLVKAIKTVEQKVKFAHSKRFGYLTFCPTNLGTTLRASVHVKIPRLSANKKLMGEVCARFKLQPRGIHGEHTESVGGVYDISNKRRLGLTEIDAVTEMAEGVKAIIAKEKELEKIWEYQGSIEDMYTVLTESNSKSLLKKYLTREVFESLKDKKTSLGGTLAHCINSGVVHLESSNGIYACDPEGYETFKDILDPIIKEYHKFENSDIKHPSTDFGNLEALPFGDVDPDGRYVVSTRVRVGRSADGIPFAPSISETQRAEVENKIMKAFEVLQTDSEYQGTYYQLPKLTPQEADQLRMDHFLFSETDDIARSAGIYRNWSDNRGIYCSNDKKFLVWVNEEDHYRLISMQKGGDLAQVYRRLVKAIKTVEQQVTFARSDRFGYLTFCPTNLGTTLRASVHVKIPRLSANKKMMAEVCAEYKLQPRGIHGEHTESVGGVYDISNKRRLGLSEIDAVTEMADGVKAIIAKEKELEKIWEYQGSIEDMYWVLTESNSKSLLKKYLTREVFDSLKDKKTSLGGTLAHCINSGIVHLESSNGIYACDPEGYETFKGILDPIIKEYHKFENSEINHPDPDFGNLEALPFGDVDPDGRYVVSTRVRVGRSADGIPFAPSISETQRAEVESKIMKAFEVLQSDNEYQGTYYQLPKLTPQEADQLRMDHFLFSETDDIARSAGIYRNWSDNRGIYCSNDKKFLVWVNEEDHYRLISMQKGGDLAQVYRRLVKAIKTVEQQVTFAHSKRFGYLTFCPTNLGTTLRASVHVKIPKLSANKKMMNELCAKHKLQPRGIHGEHTESVGGVYDISNKRRLGLTEIDAVTEMAEGVKAIIDMEKENTAIMDVAGPIDDMYKTLKGANSKSLLAKYLKDDVFAKLKDKKTKLGGTLAQCINSGVEQLDSGTGIYVCDPEGYEVFKDLLDPVVKDYHKFPMDKEIKHPSPDFGDIENLPFGNVDPEGKYVVSTRVRVGRSAEGFAFPPLISREGRKEIESKIVNAFKKLGSDQEYAGKYYSLETMSEDDRKKLVDDHFLFNDSDRFARSAGVYRNWPEGRGIYCNNSKTFLVWVNEEDHYRIISMQQGGDLAAVFKRLVKGIKTIESEVPFAHSDRLGYVTFCPTNLGTTLRASVHVKVPKLAADTELFHGICDQYKLQPRGIHGEHTESVGGVYDISNKRRLGISEIQAVSEMAEGVKAIIAKEKSL
ncbi:uncharacterized protein LOC141910149 [Tubulanus polymorphus]|uniref:uncharacterized protein LOC141910149 n=1 Tax=Tubulanus polymorphus TaxID=672921 RepID=UPI003DA41762